MSEDSKVFDLNHVDALRGATQSLPVRCKQCGYDLDGLGIDRVCPECGFPIERSIGGDELIYSPSSYLETLRRGLALIMTGVVVKLISWIGRFVIDGLASMSPKPGPAIPIEIVASSLSLIGTLILTYGWWRFSVPDPAFRGRRDGSRARKVVRLSMVANLVAQFVLVGVVMISVTGMFPSGGGPMSMIDALIILLGVVALVMWVVWFFASMVYIGWLAPRIPSVRISEKSRQLMWVGPIVAVLGAVCLMIGPLIAMLLYVGLVNMVRSELKIILNEQRARSM